MAFALQSSEDCASKHDAVLKLMPISHNFDIYLHFSLSKMRQTSQVIFSIIDFINHWNFYKFYYVYLFAFDFLEVCFDVVNKNEGEKVEKQNRMFSIKSNRKLLNFCRLLQKERASVSICKVHDALYKSRNSIICYNFVMFPLYCFIVLT